MTNRQESGAGGGTILAAFIIGAVAGAAAALLFAPAAGQETREYLGQRAREGRRRFDEQRENLAEVIRQARHEFHGGEGEPGA